MSLFISLFDETQINSFDRNILISEDKNNKFPLNSTFTSKNKDFLSLNFSNLSSGSDVSFFKYSNTYVNFIGDITNKDWLIKSFKKSNKLSNSEIIYYAYKKWGKCFPNKVYGFFSFVIYEAEQKYILAGNDHLGSKPIYFHRFKNKFIISSKIKPILLITDEIKINRDRVRDYFIFFNGKAGQTFFKNIHRLNPGSILEFKRNSVSEKKYFGYDLSNKIRYKNDHDYEEEFREIFFNAITSLCPISKDTRIGSTISGGLDSSSITAYLTKINKNIFPQSILFQGLDREDSLLADEKKYVESYIDKYSLNVNYIGIENDGCVSELKKSVQYFDEPPSLINGYIHARIFENLNKSNIKILFDGYDGDTAISHGYEHLFELGRKLKIKKLFYEYGELHKKYSSGKVNLVTPFVQYVIKSFLPKKLFWYRDRMGKQNLVPLKWYKRLNPNIIDAPSYHEILNNYNGLPLQNLYSKNSQYAHFTDITNPTIEMSMNLINESASHYGIEMKFPFMDRKLLEYCLAIPSSQKLQDGISRSILRRSMNGILPDQILNRYSKSDLSPFSRIQIESIENKKIINAAENLDIFNLDYINNFLLKNKAGNMMEIYQILIFDAWMDKNNFNF